MTRKASFANSPVLVKGSHIHCVSGSIQEMVHDRDTLLHTTNKKYHMAY